MVKNYLIGRGELLTEPVTPPPIKPTKAHPYTVEQARARLVPQLASVVADMSADDVVAPDGVHVARFALHPAYIAKSYYPTKLLQQAGLEAVGSRSRTISPEAHTTKNWEEQDFTTSEMFVAGTRASFERLSELLAGSRELPPAFDEIREIEEIASFEASDKLRAGTSARGAYELVLHSPSARLAPHNRTQFLKLAAEYGVQVNQDLAVEVRGLWFLPAVGSEDSMQRLARYSTIRVVRPMPELSLSPITRGQALQAKAVLPRPSVVDSSARVAILDGGLPDDHALTPWISSYQVMNGSASNSPGYEAHGLAVASAFLFGSMSAGLQPPLPPAKVTVIRILDADSNKQDPFELYRTLGHIEEVLLSRNYDFINLSLGPALPVEDDEVHAWTSLIDDLLSDGETLLTVAVGNNGGMDAASGNARIQVPSDAVNAVAIGSTSSQSATWRRASYSAIGPGRSPGRVKPDLVAFGGDDDEPFQHIGGGSSPALLPSAGTSLAAPLALRQAVGVRALLGSQLSPLAIRALMLHSADDGGHAKHEVGWGRLPKESESIVAVGDGMARIVYQGELRPGKYLRAQLPVPLRGFQGKVGVRATFCFASPVDTQSPDVYTRAGLDVVFRPDLKKFGKGAKTPKSRPFFSPAAYSDEAALRNDQGKWETVLHAEDRMIGTTLGDPVFDVHYNARDQGDQSRETDPLKYALVITMEAPKMVNLHQEILAAYPGQLIAIQPDIELDIASS